MHAARTQTPPDVNQLRIEMIRRQLDSRALASLSGVHVRVVQNILSGTDRTIPPRQKLNAALELHIFDVPDLSAATTH